MKIWTRCTWDKDGRLIEEDSSWIEYDGPVVQCKGGSKTVVQPAQPTPEETEFTKKQIELAEFQLEELRRQRELQEAERERLEPLISEFEELLPLQFEFATEQLERAGRLGPIEEELLQLELESIRRGGGATEQEQALIDEASARAIEQGESDIARFQTETTERIAQELAPALGLRPTDTPVLDRAARIAAEATRQQGQLVSGVRQAQATAGLNFPLARQQLQSARTQFQQQLSQATQQFQQQLSQAAVLNRLRLGGQGLQQGLGLATGLPFPSPSFPRGSTSTTSGSFGLAGFGSVLGGLGGLLSGLGAIGVSSRKFKEDPKPSDLGLRAVDHERILEVVESLPVERWRYKPGIQDEHEHIGPYAEDVQEMFKVGNTWMIHPADAVGINLSATKGLALKVRRLEDATRFRAAA